MRILLTVELLAALVVGPVVSAGAPPLRETSRPPKDAPQTAAPFKVPPGFVAERVAGPPAWSHTR